jgi:hypothetical protein
MIWCLNERTNNFTFQQNTNLNFTELNACTWVLDVCAVSDSFGRVCTVRVTVLDVCAVRVTVLDVCIQ